MWPDLRFPVNLVIFPEEIFSEKLHSKTNASGASKKYTKKTNPKMTILEILVYKIQPEIMKSKTFTRFNFITKQLCFNFILVSRSK